jgi:phospholipase/lecithinase/hemolysin
MALISAMRRIAAACGLIALIGVPTTASAGLMTMSDLFVFGDSFSDGGNMGIRSRSMTGGVVTWPPPPYYNGQFSNGPVAVEYLWKAYNPSDNSFKPSLAGGTNYSIGGATSGLSSYASVNPLIPPPLRPIYQNYGNHWQLETFAAQKPSFEPATSLFVVNLGANDSRYWAQTGGMLPGTFTGAPGGLGTIEQVVSNSISNILGTIMALEEAGAQHFLVLNLFDAGKIPGLLGTPEGAAATAYAQAYNYYLALYLTGLDAYLTNAEIVQFDFFSALNKVLANPSGYGFEVTDKACLDNLQNGLCNASNMDKWVWWDAIGHPTTSTHRLLGAALAAAVPEPATVLLVAVGLLGIAASQRRKSM